MYIFPFLFTLFYSQLIQGISSETRCEFYFTQPKLAFPSYREAQTVFLSVTFFDSRNFFSHFNAVSIYAYLFTKKSKCFTKSSTKSKEKNQQQTDVPDV